ncbi:unnamed protein product [Ectocarpus sp. 12 AP-2014]
MATPFVFCRGGDRECVLQQEALPPSSTEEICHQQTHFCKRKDAKKSPAGMIRGVRKQEVNHVDTLPVAPPATFEHCPHFPHDSLCTLSDVRATRKHPCLLPPIASKT